MKAQIIMIALMVSAVFVRCHSPTDHPLAEDNALEAVESQAKESESTDRVHQVIIEGMQFKPENLKVHAGDKVVWVNKDIVTHNVTEEPNKYWTSGNILVGNSWEMVIDKDIIYICTLHPTMKGSVKVSK